MPFAPLGFRTTIELPDFPREWEPIVHLYDPDLPLFPTHYFHVLPSNGAGFVEGDRVYGYIERVVVPHDGQPYASVVCNKNLSLATAAHLKPKVEAEVSERLGVSRKVTFQDISTVFNAPYADRNDLMTALWNRAVRKTFGGYLPFGRTWDHVLGLTRWVSSFNTDGGRKAELIMTHYFASRFGERITSLDGLPQVDFFLLPTYEELRAGPSALTQFASYEQLVRAVDQLFSFAGASGPMFTIRLVGSRQVAAFNARNDGIGGAFNTARLMALIDNGVDPSLRRALMEAYNSFNKGPPRTILFLLMLSDLKSGRLQPDSLSAKDFGDLYAGMERTYQSPKVIAMYAQQAFANEFAIPVDTWIATFFKNPLHIGDGKVLPTAVFSTMNKIGKAERLIWLTAQARKVHSSICDDALWCMKYAGPGDPQKPRGAGPLACTVCMTQVRETCPAYAAIASEEIRFNPTTVAGTEFVVTTSKGNNTAVSQRFVEASRPNVRGSGIDDFTPKDDAASLREFPQSGHNPTQAMKVSDFVALYRA